MGASTTIHYTACPICSSTAIAFLFSTTDFTVSGSRFDVWQCQNCTGAFTQDVPDASAIGPYYKAESYISHTDTRKGLVNRLYHWVRNFTLQQKGKLIRRSSGKATGTLLDIGAGTGAFAAHMKGLGWDVTALEPDPETRLKARMLHQLELKDTSSLFSLPAEQYDVITLWHVLEHVHDLQGYLARITALLRPGGLLVIAVPNYTSRDAEQYGAYWAAWDLPRHLYHFSPASMQQLVSAQGLQATGIRPMWFDSFYVSLLSEQYKTGKQQLLAGGWAGLRSNLRALRDTSACSSVIYLFRK